MNRQLSSTELATLSSPTMIPTMSRREKLLRLARLIRETMVSPVYLFSNLEHMHPSEMIGMTHPCSAFAIAAGDESLREAGLKSDSVHDAMEFFELTRDQLHAFSCDCGGAVSNDGMARRIENVA